MLSTSKLSPPGRLDKFSDSGVIVDICINPVFCTRLVYCADFFEPGLCCHISGPRNLGKKNSRDLMCSRGGL
jgi:hypothetical protein